MNSSYIERITKRHLPPLLLRSAKRMLAFPRFWLQVYRGRRGFRHHSILYPQRILFVAGLPKSGTTWIEKMLASYPGFHQLLIPDVTAYELSKGESHSYDLPEDIFARFEKMLVVTKMHAHGSHHNAQVLQKANVKYAILYRDLRDVAVSHYFYVRQTPWHPEYPIYRALDVQEGLKTFGERSLLAFAQWIRSWEQNRDKTLSVVVRYEDLIRDTVGEFKTVAKHFGLDSSPNTIQTVVDRYRFEKLSGGRKQGENQEDSFFRKGVSGDWKIHFTKEIKKLYKEKIGDFLLEFDYESDCTW